MCGAFEQSGAAETDQTRFLQSAGRPTGIRAWLSLGTGVGGGHGRDAAGSSHAVVDDAWVGSYDQTRGGSRDSARSSR